MKQSALQRQREIYLNGFSGIRSKVPIDWLALEAAAKKCMSEKAFAYVAGGAGDESTMKSNRTAFDAYKILPRMLQNVAERDMSISLFGKHYATPLLLSPVGVLSLAHKDADLAVARAAAALDIPYIFSNQASVSMEVCAAAMNTRPRWFQLYWGKSNDLVASFVQRAEACGCSAIVLTLDTTMLGWRPRDLQRAYLPFLEGKGIAQYTSDPVFLQMLETITLNSAKRKITLQTLKGLIQMVSNYPGKGFIHKLRSGKPMKAVQTFTDMYTNPGLTWNDLSFLRTVTKLPIVLKGILHPDDARKAVDIGMDGIIVSNHGGRQVDGAVSTIEMLPAIVSVVNNNIPVLLDSGVRSGADVVKALALGARAVCIGRPYVYGLAINGQAGVEEVLKNILADVELTMALAGCAKTMKLSSDILLQQ